MSGDGGQESALALRTSDRLAAVGAVLAELGLLTFFVPSKADEPLFWVLRLVGLALSAVALAVVQRAYRSAPAPLARCVRGAALVVLVFVVLVYVLAIVMTLTLEGVAKLGVEVFVSALSAFE